MTPLLSLTVILALPAPADSRAEAIAPFVGDDVAAVLHLDLKRLDLDALGRKMLGGIVPEEEIQTTTKELGGWLGSLRKAGAKDFYLLISPLPLPTNPPVAVVPLSEGADADAIGRVLCTENPSHPTWPACDSFKGAVVAASDEALQRLRQANPNPKARPELDPAFSACGESAAQLLLVPSEAQRRVFEEMVPALPQEVGGAPITTLTQGLLWAAVSLQTENENDALRVTVQAKDGDSARQLLKIAENGLKLARQRLQGDALMGKMADALKQAQPELSKDRVILSISLKQFGALAGAPVVQLRENARRSQCVNNLKQIGLAMHNYHSRHKSFPPAFSQGPDGKPLLSWRVHILPYIEQKSLYDQFHLDEPWDSPHNKALISKMPQTYACPSVPGLAESGKTTYLTPRGEKTAFPGCESIKIKQITDGTSNTVMVVDVNADQAVVWTKPDDWAVSDKIDMKAFFGNHPGRANMGYCDGSVHILRETVNPDLLLKLMTRDGGEVVDTDDY